MSEMGSETGAASRAPSLGDTPITHHALLPTTRPSKALDGLIGGLGRAFSWLWLAVVGVIVWTVVARYFFGQGSILLEELSWHISSMAWTIGIAYTLVADDHVRVDVFHERMGLRAQAGIELAGILFLLLPFLGLVIYYGIPYVWEAYSAGETSQAPSGLPHRWILKAFIPLSVGLTALAAISRALKCSALLFGRPLPIRTPAPGTETGPEG